MNLNAWLLTSSSGCAPCACKHLEHGLLSNQPKIAGLSPPQGRNGHTKQVRRTSGLLSHHLSVPVTLFHCLSAFPPRRAEWGWQQTVPQAGAHSESCKWCEGRGEENRQQQTQQPGQQGNDLLECLFLTLLSFCTTQSSLTSMLCGTG